MLTIFCTCMPFTGEREIRQYNSLTSWTKLKPTPEILVMTDGREQNVKKFVNQHEDMRIIDVPYAKCGLPYWNEMFNIAQQEAKNDIIMTSTTDIIYMQSLMGAVDILKETKFREWVATGQRWNVDISSKLDFEDNWEQQVRDKLKTGVLESPSACDFHIFTKNIDWSHMPPFIAGRSNIDTWVNADILERGIPLIHITNDVVVTHPDHQHTYQNYPDENRYNIELAANKSIGSDAANYILLDGIVKRREECFQ